MGLWLLGSAFFFYSNMLQGDSVYWSLVFSPLHLLFAFGMFAGWIMQNRRVPLPVLLFIVGSIIYAFTVCVGARPTTNSAWFLLLCGFGAMLSMLGASQLEVDGRLKIPKMLIFLGDASYSIYLIHYLAVSFLARLAYPLDRHLHLPIALWMVALFLGGIASGCLMHVWVERPIMRRLSWRRREQPEKSQIAA